MNIERIPFVGQMYKTDNKGTTVNKKTNTRGDRVHLSPEARQKCEEARLREIINNTPDIREDRVASVKKKLQNPNYLKELEPVVLETVATKIMRGLRI